MHTNVSCDILFRPQKAHRQQNQISWMVLLSAGNFLHLPLSGWRLCPFDFDRVDAGQVAVSIVQELLRCCAVLTWVLAELHLDFLVTVVDSVIVA